MKLRMILSIIIIIRYGKKEIKLSCDLNIYATTETLVLRNENSKG